MSSAPLVAPASSVQLGVNMAAAMTFNRILVPNPDTTSGGGTSFFPFKYFFQYATRRGRREQLSTSTLPRPREPIDATPTTEQSAVVKSADSECPFRYTRRTAQENATPTTESAVGQSADLECPFRYTLRTARESDIVPVCHWRSEEFGYRAHWDYMLAIYRCDPTGWFVAVDHTGEIIGNIFGMNLNDEVAFGGLFAVKKPFRCKGVGGKLWEKRLEHVGNRNLGVNAVESRILPNAKLGMTLSFRMARYLGKIPEPDQQILLDLEIAAAGHDSFDLQTFDHVDQNTDPRHFGQLQLMLNQLIDYDSTVNTIPRPSFLQATLLDQSAQMITVVATRQSDQKTAVPKTADIVGYGMVRPRYKGVTIGPLYAEDGDIARAIFGQLLTRLIKSPNRDDIMDVMLIDSKFQNGRQNEIMMEFVEGLGLERECYLYRMYSKGDINLPLDKVYGVTSSEAFLL